MADAFYSYRLDKLVQDMMFVPHKIKKGETYEIGCTYWSGRQQKYYKVINIDNLVVTVEWEDGEIGSIIYRLDWKRDYHLKPFESFINSGFESRNEFIRHYKPGGDLNSYTAAEWYALICVGVFRKDIAQELLDNFFDYYKEATVRNEVYYRFISYSNSDKESKVGFKRDIEKSPRNELVS